MIKTGNYT